MSATGFPACNSCAVERAEQRNLGPFDWSEWKAFRDEGRP
jgi:hypothetical protein